MLSYVNLIAVLFCNQLSHWLEITEKVSYIHIYSGQKLIKNAKYG